MPCWLNSKTTAGIISMKTKSIAVTCDYVSPSGDRCNYGSVGFRMKWRICPRCHGNGTITKTIGSNQKRKRGNGNAILPFPRSPAMLGIISKLHMGSLKPDDPVFKFLSKIGTKGGKTVTPKKLAHLASIRLKGQKTVTPKKLAHLASIQSKGGQTVTPKKLASLARARAARLAKLREQKNFNA